LTTAALATIDRSKLTSATGLNNLIRQLGGSFGTAIVVTLLSRKMDQARVDLVGVANPANQQFMQRWQALTAQLHAQGYTPDTAKTAALGLLDDTIQQQSAMIAYEYIFYWIGVLFVICLPLVFFLKSPRRKSAAPMPAGE
jgi:DHA2 family multidrug resistance protein